MRIRQYCKNYSANKSTINQLEGLKPYIIYNILRKVISDPELYRDQGIMNNEEETIMMESVFLYTHKVEG